MPTYIDPTAVVYPGMEIGDDVYIGPHCTIGAYPYRWQDKKGDFKVVIGDGVCIHAGTVIEGGIPMTYIGANTQIFSNCVIAHDCRIGDNCEICYGTIIGRECKIGNGVMIALGSRLRCETVVGDNAKINIGSIVVGDVERNYRSICIGVVGL